MRFMYPYLNMNNTFHNFYLLKPYNYLIIVCFLFIIQNVKSQNRQADLVDSTYKHTIKMYLSPAYDSARYTEVIRYIELPSFRPEYSIRIIESKKGVLLELFIFSESFGSQLSKSFIKNNKDTIKPNTLHYSVYVSEELTQKITQLFLKTINEDLSSNNSDTIDEVMFDGTSYFIQVTNNTSTSISFYCPNKNSVSYKTTVVCVSIAHDIQNEDFNEQEIINAIDLILK